MNFRKLIFMCLLGTFFFMAGCDPIELIVGDEVETPDANPVTNVVAYIQYGNIYTTNTKGDDAKKITSTADAEFGISLSYDKQKIAYITGTKTIKIIDINGSLLDAPTTYTNVMDIEWAKDNATLFILRANRKTIDQYGPGVTLAPYSVPSNATSMEAFSVSPNYDVAYSYYDQGFSTNYYVVKVVLNNSAHTTYSGSNYDNIAFLQFPFGSGNFISGYTFRDTYDEYYDFKWFFSGSFYNAIDFYDTDYPGVTIFKNVDEGVFSARISSSSTTINAINLFYDDDSAIKNITSFTSNTDPLIFDWKD